MQSGLKTCQVTWSCLLEQYQIGRLTHEPIDKSGLVQRSAAGIAMNDSQLVAGPLRNVPEVQRQDRKTANRR